MPKTPGVSHHVVHDWTRDGSVLVVQTYATSGDLYAVPLAGDRQPSPIAATPAYEWGATLSPDDRFVAYVTNESGQFEIVVRPFPDGNGKWQISTGGGVEPRWSRDGKTIYYTKDANMMTVQVHTSPNFSAETPEILWTGIRPLQSAASAMTFDVAPDGNGFITTRGVIDSKTNQIRVVMNGFDELTRK
jgi:Tol biopolymer transport system component